MAKRGLVLAGGGSRGAYQLGVWQAMREQGISYDLVTGTSVGALNGALMVQGDYQLAKHLWEHISSKDVVKLEGLENIQEFSQVDKEERRQLMKNFLAEVVKKGGADVTPLEELLRLYINEEKIRRSPIGFGLITVEYPSFRQLELCKEDIPEGKMADFLLATAACFPAFQAKEIEGAQYIDGGYYDNMPINLAVRMGAEEIVAVDLDGIGFRRKTLDREIPITYIRSYWNLGNFLLFERETACRNIALGYNDAMKAFGQLDGMAYTFQKGDAVANARLLRQAYRFHQQVLEKPSGGRGVMVDFGYHTVLAEIRKLRGMEKEMPLSEALTACGEICGELFELNPVPIYTFDRFNQEIWESYEALRESSLQAVRDAIGRNINIGEIIDLIQAIDRRHIACFIAERIESYLYNESGEREIALLAAAFPHSAAAAFYINGLQYVRQMYL